MSKTDQLSRALCDLEQVLRKVETGTADKVQRFARVTIADQHIEAWCEWNLEGEATRGGTSSDLEVEDRLEIRALSRQADRDRWLLKDLCRRIERDCYLLAQLVNRNVETMHPDKLPRSTIPGCRSCARTEFHKGRTIGGYFAPIREDVPGHQLCDWCYRYSLSMANESEVELNAACWPPLEACDLLHTQSPRAAGVWLAKRKAA